MGKLSEEDLYEALSLQQHLPLADIAPEAVPRRVARSLPASVTTKWKVLPFRVQHGRLDVAGPELPGTDFETDLRRHTSLEIRFHLIHADEVSEIGTAAPVKCGCATAS